MYVVVEWAPGGIQTRSAFCSQYIAFKDTGSFETALESTIEAWALMTMSVRSPGNWADGNAGVVYPSSVTPPTRQVATCWRTRVDWSAGSVSLTVTVISGKVIPVGDASG